VFRARTSSAGKAAHTTYLLTQNILVGSTGRRSVGELRQSDVTAAKLDELVQHAAYRRKLPGGLGAHHQWTNQIAPHAPLPNAKWNHAHASRRHSSFRTLLNAVTQPRDEPTTSPHRTASCTGASQPPCRNTHDMHRTTADDIALARCPAAPNTSVMRPASRRWTNACVACRSFGTRLVTNSRLLTSASGACTHGTSATGPHNYSCNTLTALALHPYRGHVHHVIMSLGFTHLKRQLVSGKGRHQHVFRCG